MWHFPAVLLAATLCLHFIPVTPNAPPPTSSQEVEEHELSNEERATLRELKTQLRSKDVSTRIGALRGIAALTPEGHPAPSRDIARTLATGLKDKSLSVQKVAAEMLGPRQNRKESVKALAQALANSDRIFEDWEKEMSRVDMAEDPIGALRLATSPPTTPYFESLVESLVQHGDEPAVQALLKYAQRRIKKLRMLPTKIVLQGLARLESQQGCLVAVEWLAEFEERWEKQNKKVETLERNKDRVKREVLLQERRERSRWDKACTSMRDVLDAYATIPDTDGPPENPTAQAWGTWYARHASRLRTEYP